jgi:hypothetical protein
VKPHFKKIKAKEKTPTHFIPNKIMVSRKSSFTQRRTGKKGKSKETALFIDIKTTFFFFFFGRTGA